MRKNPLLLLAVLVSLLTGCSQFSRTNPFDSASGLVMPGPATLSVQHVKSIEDTSITIRWDKNVDPNFYFYAVAVSTSPINGKSFRLSDTMLEELQSIPYEDLFKDTLDISRVAPSFASSSRIIRIVASRDSLEQTIKNLQPNTKYHFCIYVFLKNLRSFSASDEIVLQTTPDLKNAVYSSIYTAFNNFQTLFDVAVDNQNIYVSGFGYGIHQDFSITNKEAFGYFVRKHNLANVGILDATTTILISGGLADTNSSIKKTMGITASGGSIVVPDLSGLFNYAIKKFTPGFTPISLYPTSLNSILNVTEPIGPAGINYICEANGFLWSSGNKSIIKRNLGTLGQINDYWKSAYGYHQFFGLAVDSNDHIFVIASEPCTILEIDTAADSGFGELVRSFGGQGSDLGKLSNPHDMVLHTESGVDYLYVADTGNGRIQKFRTDGTFVSSIDLVKAYGIMMSEPKGLAISKASTRIGVVSGGGQAMLPMLTRDVLFIASKTMIVGIELPE